MTYLTSIEIYNITYWCLLWSIWPVRRTGQKSSNRYIVIKIENIFRQNESFVAQQSE